MLFQVVSLLFVNNIVSKTSSLRIRPTGLTQETSPREIQRSEVDPDTRIVLEPQGKVQVRPGTVLIEGTPISYL